MQIKWWEWEEEKIIDAIDLLSDTDIQKFILKYL